MLLLRWMWKLCRCKIKAKRVGGRPRWFNYVIRVQPHHTDYAGVVWHGTYVSWMEEARIDALRQLGIEFADLVQMGCDLPVVELSLAYHQAITLGEQVRVATRLNRLVKVRQYWEQSVYREHHSQPCVTAQVTLVPVDRQRGRILRRLPAPLQAAIAQCSVPPETNEAADPSVG
jgi:acyl-CoA thioester hydrolase